MKGASRFYLVFVILNSLFLGLNLGYFLPNILLISLGFDKPTDILKIVLTVIFSGIGFLGERKLLTEKVIKTETSENDKRDFEAIHSRFQNSNSFDKKIINFLKNLYENEPDQRHTIGEFAKRLDTFKSIPDDKEKFRTLLKQYQLSVDNEKFYERIIWQIASILIPASFGIVGYAFSNGGVNKGPLVAGFLIYLFFLFLFSRFRISLRLFRDYALFLEKVIGLYGHTFVYQTHFNKFGVKDKIWPVLKLFGLIYGNTVLYFLITK